MIDWILCFIVWRLPRKMISWSMSRALSHAISGKWSNDDVMKIRFETVARRWDEKNK